MKGWAALRGADKNAKQGSIRPLACVWWGRGAGERNVSGSSKSNNSAKGTEGAGGFGPLLLYM